MMHFDTSHPTQYENFPKKIHIGLHTCGIFRKIMGAVFPTGGRRFQTAAQPMHSNNEEPMADKAPQPYTITAVGALLSEAGASDLSIENWVNANSDDLAVLRDMRDKLHEITMRYQAALREMVVRFEILDQDLNLQKKRNPIHHIESRVKDPMSILEKLDRYGKERTIENIERYIMDIAGVRVICSYIQDVYNLYDMLSAQDDLEIITVKDYIANPKPNGYRSLHVIVKIPVYFLDEKELVPVEVQLRTIAMDFWASLEHDLKYKAQREIHGIDAYAELKNCSDTIKDVEERMQFLARALDAED